MTWKGESRRHSLARRGVKTVIGGNRRFAVNNFVARGIKSIPYFSSCVGWYRDYLPALEYIADFGETITEEEFLNGVDADYINDEVRIMLDHPLVRLEKVPQSDVYVIYHFGVHYVFAHHEDILELNERQIEIEREYDNPDPRVLALSRKNIGDA